MKERKSTKEELPHFGIERYTKVTKSLEAVNQKRNVRKRRMPFERRRREDVHACLRGNYKRLQYEVLLLPRSQTTDPLYEGSGIFESA